MTLYEIDDAIRALMDQAVDPETGEINEAAFEQLDALQMDREHKVEAIALAYKNAKAEVAAYADERAAFEQKQRRAEKQMDRLKQYLAYALNGEKFKTSKVTISYRKSTSVEVPDEVVEGLADEFKRVTYEPRKKAIAAALELGVEVPGCKLVEKQSIVVK